MKRKYFFVAAMLAVLALAGYILSMLSMRNGLSREAGEVNIVTSFYPMYTAALNVAGDVDGVSLVCLTPEESGCLHDYQLTPEDMIVLSQADIFIMNGGGLEGYLEEVAARYPDLMIIAASDIEAHESGEEEHDHDHEDSHTWMHLEMYMEQIETIAEQLSAVDAERGEEYLRNAHIYLEKLYPLQEEVEEFEEPVMVFHEAFVPFAENFDMDVVYSMDVDEDTSLSGNQMADIIRRAGSEKVSYILADQSYGKSIAEAIARETDAEVLILDSLTTGSGQPDEYINGMKENIEIINSLKKR